MLGIGSIIEKASDALGAPEWFGDVAGLVGDFASGNYVGMIEGGLDLAENGGLDLTAVIPEPLYRAGIAYLSGDLAQGGFEWSSLLGDPALQEWAKSAGAGGALELAQLFASSGVRA